MTKREFDRLTKENWNGSNMARDERCSYRNRRFLPHNGSGSHVPKMSRDYLADRANETAYLRRIRLPSDGAFAVLGIGSRWRAPAKYRSTKGQTLLTGRI